MSECRRILEHRIDAELSKFLFPLVANYFEVSVALLRPFCDVSFPLDQNDLFSNVIFIETWTSKLAIRLGRTST